MTTDARKRSLRVAVRSSILKAIGECKGTASLAGIIHGHETALLWEIIDSLVDEIEQTKSVRSADTDPYPGDLTAEG